MLFSTLSLPAVLLILKAVAAQDCSSAPITSAGSKKSQTICLSGGDKRSYTIYLPENYGSSTTLHPLILSYHGGTRTPDTQIGLDLFTTPYFNQDAVVVYPAGIDVCLSLKGLGRHN